MSKDQIIWALFVFSFSWIILLWVYCVFTLKAMIKRETYNREKSTEIEHDYARGRINTLYNDVYFDRAKLDALQKYLKVKCEFVETKEWKVLKEDK